MPLVAEDRLRGDGCHLLANIRLTKNTLANAETGKTMLTAAQLTLIVNTADDEKRVLSGWRKEAAGSLDRGVTGLDDLLGVGQVLADQNIHIRLINLPELHDEPPSH